MFSNLSASSVENIITHPIGDHHLPFSDYISRCRTIIENARTELQATEANCPYELIPDEPIYTGKKFKYGVLLIHGLLDSPFSLRDISNYLKKNGILSRAILLPGHGTSPADLLYASYHDWLQSVRYGVETLRNQVEQIFLLGYSTGAALSIYQSLQDNHIAGIILLSPAIRIKAPVNVLVGWHQLKNWISRSNPEWGYRVEETDYAKYLSIAFNAIKQVAKLTDVIHELREHHVLKTPLFMIMSREDETISSEGAIRFFLKIANPTNKMLLYTSVNQHYSDPRIQIRNSRYPDLNIRHFSHISIPFSPTNIHYGQHGDYVHASHFSKENFYGAYNHLEEKICRFLHSVGLIRARRELTYNPDFEFMADKIVNFIKNTSSQ